MEDSDRLLIFSFECVIHIHTNMEGTDPLKYLGDASFSDFNSIEVQMDEIDEETKVYTYGMLTTTRDMLGAVAGESYYVQLCTAPPMFSLFESEKCAIEVAQIPLLDMLCPELGIINTPTVRSAELRRLEASIDHADVEMKPFLEEIRMRLDAVRV